jgi:eukaryotic-like serine/threonine-protein kinase
MDEPNSPTAPLNDQTLDVRIGSYRILNPLGTGGMSSVFRAVHVETQHEVALKVLTRSLARNPTLLQRFLREARSAETLEHPNIVTIYDRGIDRGRHYLVLEYAAGGDFHDYIQRRGPLGAPEAVSVVRSVTCGLSYAAKQGVIHRDIKPSNILRTPTGQVKIIDLGLALQHEFEDERVTREGTTVGTVDYMAPEQARDSRATSVQSDLYSLGCTFYYLLAGVAPFPGGDITDKLTRHAKTPAPEIRDLRPDISPVISAIIQRMMAKRPEDRFATYDDLLVALDKIELGESGDGHAIALVPLDTDGEADLAIAGFENHVSRESYQFATNGSGDVGFHEISLVELAADDLRTEPRPAPAGRPDGGFGPAPILRRSVTGPEDQGPDRSDIDAAEPAEAVRKSTSISAFVLPAICVGAAFFLLGIGIVQFMGPRADTIDAEERADSGDKTALQEVVASSSPRPSVSDAEQPKPPSRASRGRPQSVGLPAQIQIPVHWVEPDDPDLAESAVSGAVHGVRAAPKSFPEWVQAPVPERIVGPFVVVRRAPGSKDAAAVPSLRTALDNHGGGTVEIADEGPFHIDDFRLPGESRLIRARPGFRPIIKVEGSTQDAVRRQPAVFVLDRESLTLDGLDLVVDVAQLPRNQTALFACTGVNLTLRNCSITIMNQPAGRAFALLRTESGGSRATHVRLERTLVRGPLSRGFDLAGGSVDLVLNQSVILAGPGPLVRVLDGDAAAERRFYFARSLLAGPGPIIEREGTPDVPTAQRLVVRAEDSVFGRLHGAGIASVIASDEPSSDLTKRIDWAGDRNLYAGWKGFLASGPDHTVSLADLAAVRSTWNGTDPGSHENFIPWPQPGNLAETVPTALSPFVPNHESIVQEVAQPRAGWIEKTIGGYAMAAIPEPVGWAFEPPPAGALADQVPETAAASRGSVNAASGAVELTFSTEAQPWQGDLGGFLRDRLGAARSARVRVIGSGPHRFTPVRLPRGIRLEIRVEPYSAAEPPSWSPVPEATGSALIALEEGALVLSNFVLRHDETSRLDHLIHVENGDLVLSRCRLTAAAKAADFAGDLILFRAVSTQPRPIGPSLPFLSIQGDRPVCRLVDSVLITGGAALKVELGRGQVALSHCAIASSGTAIMLLPSKVARRRFEADLSLDHCTITSDGSIILLGPWPGRAPGPDRPWLITSRNCAFLAMFDRHARDTVILRGDADALANGTAFWQVDEDATDLDFLIAAWDRPPPPVRSREIALQWANFWGDAHKGRLIVPRGPASPPVRFRERLRPGRIDPVDLVLDARYQADRGEHDLGADLSRQGITPPIARNSRGRN